MLNWDHNPRSTDLPPPATGDIAHLKLSDQFQYLFKVVIISADDNKLSGTIESIYDFQTHAQVTGGNICEHIGKTTEFHKHNLFGIVKA